MIALLYAMDEEVAGIQNHLADSKKLSLPWSYGTSGTIAGQEVLLIKTGAAKVLATMTTQYVIDNLKPSSILLTGLSGGLHPDYRRGDFVIGKDFIQHDIRSEFFGFENGQIPFTNYKIVPADQKALDFSVEFKLADAAVHLGRILSGEQFISGSRGRELRSEFQGDLVDMESAAVALVCYLNRVPFIVGRTVSDSADEGAASDFGEFLSRASEHVLAFLTAVVRAGSVSLNSKKS